MEPTGIAVGLNKGHKLVKRARAARPSHKKGKLGNKVQLARSVIREVAGFAPYERRVIELLRVGKDKRALKVAKQRLGSHQRGKQKRSFMQDVITKQRQKK